MFYEFATVDDVRKCGGKTNWFVCSDGSFFTCGDCATDSEDGTRILTNTAVFKAFDRPRKGKPSEEYRLKNTPAFF